MSDIHKQVFNKYIIVGLLLQTNLKYSSSLGMLGNVHIWTYAGTAELNIGLINSGG